MIQQEKEKEIILKVTKNVLTPSAWPPSAWP
jgi:hypothetical protein